MELLTLHVCIHAFVTSTFADFMLSYMVPEFLPLLPYFLMIHCTQGIFIYSLWENMETLLLC